MSNGVREARPIELMKMNNLLVLVFRRTKLENMLCRCGMVGTIHLPCKTGNAHPYLEMLGGQNFYFCIDVRPSSSECAQNHCLFLEDRSRGQFFDARSQTHNTPLFVSSPQQHHEVIVMSTYFYSFLDGRIHQFHPVTA